MKFNVNGKQKDFVGAVKSMAGMDKPMQSGPQGLSARRSLINKPAAAPDIGATKWKGAMLFQEEDKL
jgi:hypothetical protein